MYKDYLQLSEKGVTVFAPHPDDEVFGCGGLLALLVQQGRTIRVVIVSDGGYGDHGRDTPARKQESCAAAAILGYSTIEFWDLPDQGLNRETDLSHRMQQHLAEYPSSLVLAPSLWEIHPDHIAVCRAATEAVSYAASAPALWYYEVGVPMPRPFIVDITSVSERKSAAMNCFKSQIIVQDYASQISGLNAYRGYTLPRFGAWGEAYVAPEPGLYREDGLDFLFALLAGQLQPSGSPVTFELGLAGLQQAIATLSADNARLEAECAALYASSSWRVTAPLRQLAKVTRRLFQNSDSKTP